MQVGPFRIIPDKKGSHFGNRCVSFWDLQQTPDVTLRRHPPRHYQDTLEWALSNVKPSRTK